MTKAETEKYICDLRDAAYPEYVPVMRPQTSALLAELVEKYNPKTVLEIGTCIGVSGLTVLCHSNAFLTTVEIDENRWIDAKKNFHNCGFNNRVNAILGDSDEVIDLIIDEKYDFAIMDGAKAHYLKTYKRVLPLLNKGGIIFVDDVDFHDMLKTDDVPHKHRTIVNGMKSFLEYVYSDKEVIVTKYDVEDGVLVIEKR